MGPSLMLRRLAVLCAACGIGATATGGVVIPPVAATPSAVLSPPEGSIPDLAALGWRPVLDENFNGTAVDESVWSIAQSQSYIVDGVRSRDAVRVAGGNLSLTTYTDAAGKHHVGGLESSGLGHLNPSWGGFQATYGYVEARMLFPDGPDSSSTFWMMSNNGNSPPFGDPGAAGPELDIVEHANKPTSGPGSGDSNADGKCDWPAGTTLPCNQTFLAGGHWDGFGEEHKIMSRGSIGNPNPAVPLQGNFHTYGMLWTPEDYRFFIDGIEVKRVTAALSYTPEYVILMGYANQGTATNFGPLGSAANDVTLVDYVKVWQRPVSEVPNQSTAATTPLAVPFTVSDYAYGSPTRAEPGSVTVTATSSNPAVVPNSGLAVSGNGPADPDGSFTDGGFESGASGWALSGAASVWATKKHAGAQALHLTQAGGTAIQTITGLRPGTTYLVGGHYELDLGFSDVNGNGRVNSGEPFTESGDGVARFDWGILDVDVGTSGYQGVRTSYERNGWSEDDVPTWWQRTPFPHEMVKFTTGPTTTAVTMYVDNRAYAGESDDSDVTFDSFHVLPVVSPRRALSIRPDDGKVGDTTITLTARDAAGATIGSDAFDLTVGVGTLRDGGFELGEATTPWELMGAPAVVTPAPFRGDHQLRLGQSQPDTAVQRVTGLDPNSRYRLEVTGHNAQAAGDFTVGVQAYGGAGLTAVVGGTATTTHAVEFVTGTSNTGADVMLLDWVTGDGESYVEEVKLSKCSTTTSCATPATGVTWDPPPALAAVGPRYGVSGVPLDIGAQLPAGATFTRATSTNKQLVPDTGIAATGSGGRRTFTVTPVPDRTGKTKIRVEYAGAAGSPFDIPVVVSDAALLQPGFEKGTLHWTVSGTAGVFTWGQHGGTTGMLINGDGEVKQTVVGLAPGLGYVLDGWIAGRATVTVRTAPVDPNEEPEVLASATWTGTGWVEQVLPFTSLPCGDCRKEDWRPVEIVLEDADPGDGAAVGIDDLALIHAPAIRKIRDLSLHSSDTAWDWETRTEMSMGRIPENGLWDPAVRTVTTADIAGFGTGVVTTARLNGPTLNENGWPFLWWLESRAGAKTGRSLITVRLTDPATGATTAKSYAVTVNAGDNFDNGDFERSNITGAGVSEGWGSRWYNDSVGIVKKQAWPYLGVHDTRWTYAGPRDDNHVLRISSGAVGHVVTGLTPDTQYTVKLRAKGSGSTVSVKAHDDVLWAPVLGSITIEPPNSDNVWRDYELRFTTGASGEGSTSVALFVADANMADSTGDGVVNALDAVPASSRYCAIYTAGETCLDDIGIFEVSDVG